jgi:very-short-patch-repair endonuclease
VASPRAPPRLRGGALRDGATSPGCAAIARGHSIRRTSPSSTASPSPPSPAPSCTRRNASARNGCGRCWKPRSDGRSSISNSIEATIARNPGRHGIARLTEAITYLADEAPWTPSHKERHFLELIRAHGLPEPSVNVVVLQDPVDFFWPASKLIVEVDGWEFHKTHEAFEADRVKDAKHHVAGFTVLRITARRIDRDAPAVAGEIRALLRRGSEPWAASGR